MADVSTKTILAPETNVAPFAVSQPLPRLHFIDGLRGLAMLMVLLFHCWLFSGQWVVALPLGIHRINLASFIGFGHIGVNLFLVLSGFCLYWPFVKGGARQEPTLWEFTKKRCRRILPPYYVTLLLYGMPFFLLAMHHHSPSEINFAWNWLWLHAVMAQNLAPDYVIRVDAPLWTLALEFQLYILFPVFVEAFRRFNPQGVALITLLVSSAYRFFIWQGQVHPSGYYADFTSEFVLDSSVFGRCFEFVMGMYCARLVARWYTDLNSPLRWSDFLLFALIIPLYFLDHGRGILIEAMWGLGCAALLLSASRPRSIANRILSHRALMSLGIFSYSVYLIHQPLIEPLGRFAVRHFSKAIIIGFELVLVVPLMLGLGYLFHLLFEKPFLTAPRSPEVPSVLRPVQKTFAE